MSGVAMRSGPRSLALALLLPSTLVGQGLKTVAKVPAAFPTAAPTPTHASLASKSTKPAAISALVDIPLHSPQQLEFGAVWNGQSSRRTFALTTTAAGNVAVQVPPGPFRIVEFRLMSGPPAPINGAAARIVGSSRQVELRLTYSAAQPAPPLWNVGAGKDIELDAVFEPKFDLFSMTAGPKSEHMKVAGLGPTHPWSLSIPLQGTFNGLHVETIFTVDDKEVQVVSPAKHLDVQVRVVGVDTAVSGMVRGGTVPAGVTVGSVPLSVKGAQTVTAKLPVSLSWGALKPDGVNRDVELVFDAGGHSSKARFSVVPVPGSVDAGGQRADCGIGWLGWNVVLSPDGRLNYSLSGNNQDLVNVRDILTTLSVAGRVVAWGYMHLDFDPGGKTTTSSNHWNSANLPVNFNSRFGPADYVPAVRGGVAFSCKLVNFDFKPPF